MFSSLSHELKPPPPTLQKSEGENSRPEKAHHVYEAPANFKIPKILTKFSFSIGMVKTEKIPKGSYRNTESVSLIDTTRLSCIYLRAGGSTVSYVNSYQVQNTLLRINYLTCLVSTMAPSGFGSYHCMWLEDAQTKCIGVIPIPWAMTHALGLVSFPLQHE